jgi:hypothetical protein
MPVGWLTMGTPEDLKDLLVRGDRDEFVAQVDRRVEDAGAVTIKILWEDDGLHVQVLVAVPAETADRVFPLLADVFQADVKRLWNLQELKRRGSSGS